MVKKWIKQKLRDIFDAGIQNSHKMIMENYWAQVFNSTIYDSDFLAYKTFSPGRWAASYSFLYVLYRALNEFKPKRIIEFGLGETSKMTIQYASKHLADLCIIEQDSNWIEAFSNKVPQSFNVNKWTKVYELEEYDNGYSGVGRRYKNFATSDFLDKYDFFVIDGPFGSAHFSRTEILGFIEQDKLQDDFVIILDDCGRLGEIETFGKIQELLKQKKSSMFGVNTKARKNKFCLQIQGTGFSRVCRV